MHDQRRQRCRPTSQHQDPAAHQQRDAGRQAEAPSDGRVNGAMMSATVANPAADHRHQSNVGQEPAPAERHVSARHQLAPPSLGDGNTQTRPPLAIDVVKPIQTICSILKQAQKHAVRCTCLKKRQRAFDKPRPLSSLLGLLRGWGRTCMSWGQNIRKPFLGSCANHQQWAGPIVMGAFRVRRVRWPSILPDLAHSGFIAGRHRARFIGASDAPELLDRAVMQPRSGAALGDWLFVLAGLNH